MYVFFCSLVILPGFLFFGTFPKKLEEILNNFYAKKIYIDFLRHINQIPSGDNWKHGRALVFLRLQEKYCYSEGVLNVAKNDLFDNGYIVEHGSTHNIFITDTGREFIQDYARFFIRGNLAKFTIIFKENFSSIGVVLSLIFSFIALLK